MEFGFIGCGNMGGALARAVCRQVSPSEVLLSNRTPERAVALAAELGCAVGDNRKVAGQSKYIFLGVKPQMLGDLLGEIGPVLAGRSDRFVLVSMAAGIEIAAIRTLAGGDYPVLRIMPNTPSSIGEGMVLYTPTGLERAELERLCFALSGAGRTAELAESLMDAGSAVSGCGPAFAYLFIEALADGGVSCGLPRGQALEYAAQTLAGAARLVLESGAHPGALKDAVCSQGGSTIEGVLALERGGFRAAAAEAVRAAYTKTRALGGK